MSVAASVETVAFDVGGKAFKVSRSLIEQYSETMLGRIVSKTWQGDSNEPVFIDRNGDLFAHVLDYLRYGSIDLPLSTPRSNFIRELDFYGISFDDTDMKQFSSVDELERLKESVDDAELGHDMFLIAVHAYHKLMAGAAREFTFNNKTDIGLKRNPYNHSLNTRTNAGKTLKCYLMSYYGLDAHHIAFSKAYGVSLRVKKAGDETPNEGSSATPVTVPFRQIGGSSDAGRIPPSSFGTWNINNN